MYAHPNQKLHCFKFLRFHLYLYRTHWFHIDPHLNTEPNMLKLLPVPVPYVTNHLKFFLITIVSVSYINLDLQPESKPRNIGM